MKRLVVGLGSLLVAVLSMGPAAASLDSEAPDDVEFIFARIRYHMTEDAFWEQRRELPWHHDHPLSEEAYLTILKEVSQVHTAPNAYQIVDIDSPDIFKFPYLYICEPGFMDLNEKDTKNLREYLERGGFIFFDDFRGQRHLQNLLYQMKKVFPNRNLVPLTLRHTIFDTFYKMESLDMRPPYGNAPVEFWGMENDNGSLMMVVNYNNDFGELWQWLDEGTASLQDAAESLKFGTNYLMYAFTH